MNPFGLFALLLHLSFSNESSFLHPRVWLGFYDDVLSLSSPMTTLHVASDPADAIAASFLGQRSLLSTRHTFLNGTRLRDDWRLRWLELSSLASPLIANGTIIGFFLGDELVWNCLPFSTFTEMASTIRATFPSAVTWVNEATPVITLKINRCLEYVDYRIGGPVSWFSIDQYHFNGPDSSFVKETMMFLYTHYIFPHLDTTHHAVLVPGSFGSTHNEDCDLDCYSEMCKLDAELFVEWALEDERIVGVIPWHFRDDLGAVKYMDEIGTVHMAEVWNKWKELGERMK